MNWLFLQFGSASFPEHFESKNEHILVCSNLHIMNLIPLSNPYANLFQCLLHKIAENVFSILRRHYQMVQQQILVMSLDDMLAHASIIGDPETSINERFPLTRTQDPSFF